MAFFISLIFLSSWTAVAAIFPYNTLLKESFESSGSGPDETVRGTVKVVQLDPSTLNQSGFFRRGLVPRRVHSARPPFPAFLSHGRPGQAPVLKAPVSPLHKLHSRGSTEAELKKKQGLQMWQKVTDKGSRMSLPVNLKDAKQTCTAVSFTQVRGRNTSEMLFLFFKKHWARSDSNQPLLNVFPACDGRRMPNGDCAQQAVLRPVQLALRPVRGGVCWAEPRVGGLPPPGPLLPLRPRQSSHHHCAPAVWGWSSGEASDGGGRVQMWHGPRRAEIWGCALRTPVKVLAIKTRLHILCYIVLYYIISVSECLLVAYPTIRCWQMTSIFSRAIFCGNRPSRPQWTSKV